MRLRALRHQKRHRDWWTASEEVAVVESQLDYPQSICHCRSQHQRSFFPRMVFEGLIATVGDNARSLMTGDGIEAAGKARVVTRIEARDTVEMSRSILVVNIT